jgi:hypothetical protein
MSTATSTISTTKMGGKRKINKSLKAWITFVKKVQKEEKLSYKDAIHRAKVRKDKGEKWMSGGDGTSTESFYTVPLTETTESDSNLLGVVGKQLAGPASGVVGEQSAAPASGVVGEQSAAPASGVVGEQSAAPASGGKRRRKSRTMRRSRKGGRRSRRRASRRN